MNRIHHSQPTNPRPPPPQPTQTTPNPSTNPPSIQRWHADSLPWPANRLRYAALVPPCSGHGHLCPSSSSKGLQYGLPIPREPPSTSNPIDLETMEVPCLGVCRRRFTPDALYRHLLSPEGADCRAANERALDALCEARRPEEAGRAYDLRHGMAGGQRSAVCAPYVDSAVYDRGSGRGLWAGERRHAV